MTREQILEKLVEKRVLSRSEANSVRVRLTEDASEAEVLSLIKGQFTGISPRDVTNALFMQISVWNEVQGSNFTEYDKVVDREQGMKDTEAFLQGGGFGEFEEPNDGMALDPKWEGLGFGDGSEALDFVETEFSKMLTTGVFSQDEETNINSMIQRLKYESPSPEKIQSIFRAMSLGGAREEDMVAVRKPFKFDTDYGVDPYEQAFIDEKQPKYKGFSSLDPIQQAEAIVDSTTTMSAAEGSFQRLVGEALPEGVTIATRERLDYTGSGTVFDRATGQVLSQDEWNLLQTSEEAMSIYREAASTSEIVQQLLDSGKFKVSSQYQTSKAQTTARNWIPVEDLAIPTVGGAVEPWQADTYDYKVGDGRAEWIGMSPIQRNMRIKLMIDNGLVSSDVAEAINSSGQIGGNPLNLTYMNLWESAVSISSEFQFSPLDGIRAIGEQKAANLATQRGSGGGGRIAPTYSVPASLREIPDYKTLAQNTKQIFAGQLGREMEDWELQLYAEELKQQNISAREELIAINKEAWNDAVSGGTTDVDYTAVEDPNTALDYDIEEAYANEINRNVRVEDKANQRRLLMQSISVGNRMI